MVIKLYQWTRDDFINVINNVKDLNDKLYPSICTLLQCLKEDGLKEALFVFVKLIWNEMIGNKWLIFWHFNIIPTQVITKKNQTKDNRQKAKLLI